MRPSFESGPFQESTATSRRLVAISVAASAALVVYWICAASGWPAGLRGPTEPLPIGWNWPMIGARRRHVFAVPALAGLVIALVFLAGYGVAGSASLRRRRAAVAFLPVACFTLMILFLAAKSDHPFRLLFARAYDDDFLGAIQSAFAATFHDLSAGYVAFHPYICFHCQTHPPGPILFCWVFVKLFEAFPYAGTAAPAVADALGVPAQALTTLPPQYFLALVSSTLAILLCGSLVPVVVHAIARSAADRRTAYFVAALSALSPGLVLMTPEFDQLEALPVLVAYALALRSVDRASRLAAFGAGLALAVGTYFTFFSLVFGLPLALVWLLRGLGGDGARARLGRGVLLCASGLAGFLAFFLTLWITTGTDIIAIYIQSAPAHFGLTNTRRPYWLYFWHDPLDFANFVGMPVVLAAIAGLFLRQPARLHAWCGVAVVGFLAVSGLQRGEAGRIWLCFAPLFYLGTLPLLSWARERGFRHAAPALFGLQAIGCVVLGISWLVP